MWVRSLDREHPWRRKWQPTPVFLPGKSHEPRSLAGDSHGVTKRSLWGQSMGSHTPLGHTTDHSTHTAGSVLNFVNRGCWTDTAGGRGLLPWLPYACSADSYSLPGSRSTSSFTSAQLLRCTVASSFPALPSRPVLL